MNSSVFRVFRAAWFLTAALSLLAWSLSGLAQGWVDFNNHIAGSVITHIYQGGDQQLAGNGANDYPVGTQDWTGFTPLLGTGYTAQLWAADGINQPESSLQPVLPTTAFYTVPAGAGWVYPQQTLALPGVPLGDPATIIVRVWDNQGGTVTSWAMAQAAGLASGESPLLNISATGTGSLPPAPLSGLLSFNIYLVPEPPPFAFIGLGAFLLWFGQSRNGSSFTPTTTARTGPVH